MATNEYMGFNTTQIQTLRALLGDEADASDLATLNTKVNTIVAWGTALATKLNADAGVTDTNYDTTPAS